MNRIKTYDAYTEITNGLFVDIEDKKDYITKNDIEELLKSTIGGADIINSSNREVVLFSSAEGARQFNRAIQEEAYTQSINMSEEELIQYFDRISQEEN